MRPRGSPTSAGPPSPAAVTAPSAYREDIDGLRAVAVLAVLAFHAFPGRLSGGFSGVDVFFVISGFLISRNICARLDDRRFSLLDFYARRVRRIFPALLVVLAACAVFGWVVLLPDELTQLFDHVWSSAAFVQNFRLLAESGYFDTDSALKPLLHLWSLSIEEQFYLLCPLLLMQVRAPRLRLALVLLLTLLSFTANLRWVVSDPAGAYYLPHTRFWQILAGVVLALAPRARLNTQLRGAIAWLGALLLTAGFALLTKGVRYPGWWGLVPTLGAVFLIGAGPDSWLAINVLSRRAVTFIGRISYPLYLWHWPILVFIRILGATTNPSTTAKIVGLGASFVLAMLTYWFIEQPGQRDAAGAEGSQRRVTELVLAMVCVGSIALILGRWNAPLPRPIASMAANESALRDLNFAQYVPKFPACSEAERAAMQGLGYCMRSAARNPTAAILGDSHAYRIFSGVASIDTRRVWLLAGNQSCPPVIGLRMEDDQIDCLRMSESAIRAVAADPAIATVVLAFWGGYASNPTRASGVPDDPDGAKSIELKDTLGPSDSNAEMMLRGLDRSITALEAASKQVVLFVDVPGLPFQPRDCIDRPLAERKVDTCSITRALALARQGTLRGLLQRLAEAHPALRWFDPLPYLCEGNTCPVKRGDLLMYQDSNHLSLRGSAFLARPFLQWLGP